MGGDSPRRVLCCGTAWHQAVKFAQKLDALREEVSVLHISGGDSVLMSGGMVETEPKTLRRELKGQRDARPCIVDLLLDQRRSCACLSGVSGGFVQVDGEE